jgi:AhpD family alkylhydroperoxidase
MRNPVIAIVVLACVSTVSAQWNSAKLVSYGGPAATDISFADLGKKARERTSLKARVALAEVTDLKNADVLESGNVPNYIKALAQNTKAAPQFAYLLQTFLFAGTIAPETKIAMGLKVAQIYASGYTFAHSSRWLRATPKGRQMLESLADARLDRLSESQGLAIRYADLLSRDVHGVSDAEFEKLRGSYNDSQIVELTMTVCFFNYFVRLAEALNLPVETWVLDDRSPVLPAGINRTILPISRIALVSDVEMNAVADTANAAKDPQKSTQSLGLGIANSQRAMLRVPALAQAWREYGAQNRQAWSIDRNIQLQVSFAVSNANGCRYCTLHQVLGLRRLGVDPKKLMAMKTDDSLLTPKELAAVKFARKLTADPGSVSDEDFNAVKSEFGEQGAVEITMQTASFAFMNRFTDNLRLPSEDEAIRNYKEVYSEKSMEQFKY